ncbi:MAG: radical SAM family heme chaperone HemW [Candidatus Acidiferrales bacterium]
MPHGLYIQVPFCQTKCTYCNFHTGVFSAGLQSPYISAVCREMKMFRKWSERAGLGCFPNAEAPLSIDTVYVGGGTPSMLDPADLARLLDTARESFPCDWTEVTLEADPETITPERAAAWRAAGFNRISLGAQSFDDRELAAAGRLHRRVDLYAADRTLRDAGFANISFDLIAGLAHQTRASWSDSLQRLIDLHPEHISIYMLEIDEASRLGAESLAGGARYGAGALPSDDDVADFYESARSVLAAARYEQYEISSWARPGFRSRHNLKYWQRQPYFGFGAGAHSFDGRERWAKVHDPAAYTAAIEQGLWPIEQRQHVSPAQALEEELFLGLRQLDGIDVAAIEAHYGRDLHARLVPLLDQGLIELNGSTLRLAPARLAVSNEVFVSLLD